MELICAGRTLDLSVPAIMGIVNVTPDSFSDGGRFFETEAAIDHGCRLAEDGADILDVGGESTRPGAQSPDLEEELRRVIPVIDGLRRNTSLPISIDTSNPEVMRRAVEAGAGLLNDVRAFQSPGALEAAVECNVPVCIMHMQGEPGTMQKDPRYKDVVAEVLGFLKQRADELVAAGIAKGKIIIDPGFGFGKTLEHNLTLLRQLHGFAESGFPVLAGLSRKSMIAKITGNSDEPRLGGSIALALHALQQGARILRVHDVQATRQAVTVWQRFT